MNDNYKALILLLISYAFMFYGASILFEIANSSSNTQTVGLLIGSSLMILSIIFHAFGKHYNLKYEKQKQINYTN